MSQNDTLIYPYIDFKRNIGGDENSMYSKVEQKIPDYHYYVNSM